MKTFKITPNILFFLMITLLIVSCATSNENEGQLLNSGIYVKNIDAEFNSVYKASRLAIESGEAYDLSGKVYSLRESKVTDSKAIIQRVSKSDAKDYVYIVILKKDENTSQVKIKYGNKGDSIKSSALMDMIEKSLKYSVA